MAYEADASLFYYPGRVEQIYKELAVINELKRNNTISNPGTAQALIAVLHIRDAAQTQVGVNFITSLERFAKEEAKYRRASLFVTVLLIFGILLFSYIAILPMLPSGAFSLFGRLDPLLVPSLTQGGQSTETLSTSLTPRVGVSFLEAFPDDVFRLYVLTNVITDGRTETDLITEDDIALMAAWTDLDLNGIAVVDDTGIAYFPASVASDGL